MKELPNLYLDQILIVKYLGYSKSLSFSEIRKMHGFINSDNLAYHLKKLVGLNIISKVDVGYVLTQKGKVLLTRIDIDKNQLKIQAKIHVVAICKRKNKGKIEYLVHKRLKHPFYSYVELPSSKIDRGQFLSEAAKEALLIEQGLVGDPLLKMVRHIHIYTKDSEKLVEDKIFYYFVFENISGKLIPKIHDGTNHWMTKNEMLKEPLHFKNLKKDSELNVSSKFELVEEDQFYDGL